MKLQYATTMMVAIAAVATTFLLLPNTIQQKAMAQEWNGGYGRGGYDNDNDNGYNNGYAPYAYNPGGGVPGPVGGPGSGLVSTLLSAVGLGGLNTAYGAGTAGGYGGYGGYNHGGSWGGVGVGGCCHPFYYWHPWYVNWCGGCTCVHPYVPHPAYYPRPYYPAYPIYNQEQRADQNVVTSVEGSPGANVNVYANQDTGQQASQGTGSDLVP
jgi:hypothetical protein